MPASLLGTNEILDHLYQNHYLSPVGSIAASSHWLFVGQQTVRKTASGWWLEGSGFGSRREDTLLNKCLRWPSSLMSERLLADAKCSNQLIKIGRMIAGQQGRLFDFDCVRQVLTMDLLLRNLEVFFTDVDGGFSAAIVIIGDGYGYLGALLKARFPRAIIVEVNLGRTLFFDAYYLGRALPAYRHRLSTFPEFEKGDDFIYIEAEHMAAADHLDAHLFINIASMQEMNPPVVEMYMQRMRASRFQPAHFYCCNREEKILPDGTISRFVDYGWQANDTIILGKH